MRWVRRALTLALLTGFGLLASWLWKYQTFRLFFSWPAGATWSNMIASLEWAVVGGSAVFFFRDRVGRRVTAWWHAHAGEHIAVHVAGEVDRIAADLHSKIDELREHVGNGILADLQSRIDQMADQIHERFDDLIENVDVVVSATTVPVVAAQPEQESPQWPQSAL